MDPLGPLEGCYIIGTLWTDPKPAYPGYKDCVSYRKHSLTATNCPNVKGNYYFVLVSLPFCLVVAKLSKRLRENDQPQHEAMCHLAIARCEQSVGNTACEAEALVAASRAFLQAERKIKAVCCPSIEDHLTAGRYTRHKLSLGVSINQYLACSHPYLWSCYPPHGREWAVI